MTLIAPSESLKSFPGRFKRDVVAGSGESTTIGAADDSAERCEGPRGGLRQEEVLDPDSAARIPSSTSIDSSSSETGGAERCSRDLPGLRSVRAIARSWRVLGLVDLLYSPTGLDWLGEIEDLMRPLEMGCAYEGTASRRRLWLNNQDQRVRQPRRWDRSAQLGSRSVQDRLSPATTCDPATCDYIK